MYEKGTVKGCVNENVKKYVTVDVKLNYIGKTRCVKSSVNDNVRDNVMNYKKE